jgi:acetyl esterase/lipase
MPSLPTTEAEILATGTIDPAVAKVLEANPLPSGSSYTLPLLKQLTAASLPKLQEALSSTRPPDVLESEHNLTHPDGWTSRLIICAPTTPVPGEKSPLIVIFYGGGHTVGHPESEVPLARLLVERYGAVVVLPTYKLAPEFPFPGSVTSSWSTIQLLAADLSPENKGPRILPPYVSASHGFLIGGSSSGANISAAIAHKARDENLSPPLTGQFLFAGSFISPYHVPPKYASQYLSRIQNINAPVADANLIKIFLDAFKPDHTSPLWASITANHEGVPPAYFQICGTDLSRDDSLIYETILREECGIVTRADLYAGMPHCWWAMDVFKGLKATESRKEDAVRGIGWLLGRVEDEK